MANESVAAYKHEKTNKQKKNSTGRRWQAMTMQKEYSGNNADLIWMWRGLRRCDVRAHKLVLGGGGRGWCCRGSLACQEYLWQRSTYLPPPPTRILSLYLCVCVGGVGGVWCGRVWVCGTSPRLACCSNLSENVETWCHVPLRGKQVNTQTRQRSQVRYIRCKQLG